MTSTSSALFKKIANRWLDWLVQPGGSSLLRNFCKAGLWLCPPAHGLYLYRTGRLSEARNKLKFIKIKSRFFERIILRIEHMLKTLREGWQFDKVEAVQPPSLGDGVVFSLHNSLPYDTAGYALRSHQLLKHLAAQNVNFKAITRPGYPTDQSDSPMTAPSSDSIDGIEYHRLTSSRAGIGDVEAKYITEYARSLTGEADTIDAGIIHAASNYLDGLAAVTAAKQSHRKSIYEVRGLWHKSRAVREPGYQETEHYRYAELCEFTAAREADAVITISTPLKELLVRNGVAAEKITLVPNAVDTDLFSPTSPDETLRNELGIPSHHKVVGFIGSLTDYEGVDIIIKAVSQLDEQEVPVTALIAGKGYAEGALHTLRDALPNPGCALLTGHIPFDEVERYYSIIDICAYPRKDHEVCQLVPPLKVLEAMAMGKPVVVSALPPLMEVIRHEETGRTCEPNSVDSLARQLRHFVENPEAATTIGNAGRDWVLKNRSWKAVTAPLDALYASLAGK